MPLPDGFKGKLKLSATFDVPLGEDITLRVRRIKAAEFRDCERKFAPKARGEDSDTRYMGAIRHGVTAIKHLKGPWEECTLDGDDVLSLWQHVGRMEGSATAMEILFQWGFVQAGRDDYLAQMERVLKDLEQGGDGKVSAPATDEGDEDPLSN